MPVQVIAVLSGAGRRLFIASFFRRSGGEETPDCSYSRNICYCGSSAVSEYYIPDIYIGLCHYGAAKSRFVLNGQGRCVCSFFLDKAASRSFAPVAGRHRSRYIDGLSACCSSLYYGLTGSCGRFREKQEHFAWFKKII
ncbi:MAG: hypothetical protein DU429_05055 [Candidatus Tokpelaia sp.]|nr:MAG: hypothetical protein DU430_07995 [Candidatus Tokpelaia sp.]KAA6206831.1 MAG: hypothetical protein DU429_05055 [Candidatus Tokpelaia sp.]KAA6404593.1 hypothetical protein DPQ22_08920 [Candidatus Tokpelaia sp.]